LILDHSRLNFPARDLVEVLDDNGRQIWRSQNWQGATAGILASPSPTFKLSQGQSSYRGIVVHKATIFDEEDNRPGQLRKVTIAYAASTRELDRRVFKIGLFAAGLSLLLVSFAGLFAAHGVTRGLEPVQQLAMVASKVSARNWNFSPPRAARDMKELAPLADALDATLARLQLAFDRERQFIADAAHELKTAVAILKSSLQLLVYQPRSNEEYRKGLDRSLEDCSRVEALVLSTLTLARAEQQADEQPTETLQPIDLVSSCKRSVADLTPMAQARGIELRYFANKTAMVKADPLGLHTVWVNLLQNAIQHSPERSVVRLRLAAAERNTVSVIIEDSGSGIPAEELPHVFDRFRRGDPSRSRNTGGFGLGLSICKAIVESAGGTIQITSPNGHGTSVSVFLPAMPELLNGNPTS
jgi:signal transduction histidine kinase